MACRSVAGTVFAECVAQHGRPDMVAVAVWQQRQAGAAGELAEVRAVRGEARENGSRCFFSKGTKSAKIDVWGGCVRGNNASGSVVHPTTE